MSQTDPTKTITPDALEEFQDTAIQSLYAVSLRLENCLQLLDDAPENVRPELNSAIKSLNSVIRDVRRSIFHLPPIKIEDLSLDAGLEVLLADLRVNSLISIDLVTYPEIVEIARLVSPVQTNALLEIAREALANVREHSLARSVSLELSAANGKLLMKISDDGVGAMVDAFHSSRGISDMRHRAIELGGNLDIVSQRGLGTTVTVTMPLDKTNA